MFILCSSKGGNLTIRNQNQNTILQARMRLLRVLSDDSNCTKLHQTRLIKSLLRLQSFNLLQDVLRCQKVPHHFLINSGMLSKLPDCYKSCFTLVIFFPDVLKQFSCCTGASTCHLFHITCINHEAMLRLFRQMRHRRH